MKHSKIDYAKLNDRIVEQVNESVKPYVMSKEDTARLIQEKFDRAMKYSEALKNSPVVL
jgi:hypothetical protein